MAYLPLITSISFAGIAGILFYISNTYRARNMPNAFEFVFFLGNVMVIATLWIIYAVLNQEGSQLSDLAFALFNGFLWLYIVMMTLLFLKLLLTALNFLMTAARRLISG